MAAKKFYAVKKGKKTGIFATWEECKAAVEGVSGAQYKGFPTKEEAFQYLGWEQTRSDDCPSTKNQQKVRPNTLTAYVDGSYDDSVKKYAFGCVFLTTDGSIYVEFGNGDNPQSLQHRNVTGEMLGAMYAVRTAMFNGFEEIDIFYDYEGIEKWVTGQWRSKTFLTGKYADSMRKWGKDIQISFHKVAAHTNVKYNELADKMAKRGITEGQGIPGVRRLSELNRFIEENVTLEE